jgi:hypothetical protein
MGSQEVRRWWREGRYMCEEVEDRRAGICVRRWRREGMYICEEVEERGQVYV